MDRMSVMVMDEHSSLIAIRADRKLISLATMSLTKVRKAAELSSCEGILVLNEMYRKVAAFIPKY